MNTSYVVYDETTGRIRAQIVCPPPMIRIQLSRTEAAIEGSASSGDSYVDLSTLTIQPMRSFTLSDIPLPCIVTIEGVSYECDTTPAFEFDVPGTYRITIDAGAQYRKGEFEYDYPSLDS